MIDANLNRSSEGLRVLEDIARFLLNSTDVSQRLKALRHDLAQQTTSLSLGLLSGRDAEHDIGRPRSQDRGPIAETASLEGLQDLVAANAKRVQEALRVIEEVAKLPEMNSQLNSAGFEQARFALYALERDLISRVSRRDKTDRIAGLYVILDRHFLGDRDELEVARQVVDGGARIIQLRDKQSKKGELLRIAQELKDLCSQAGVLFIANDYLDLALAADADGLHIGQDDLPLHVARRELPIDRIIGCSVTTSSQAMKAQNEGVDYVAIGSVYPTLTKKESVVVGVDAVRELKGTISTPVVAIGGINESNVAEVVAAGADAVAVVSAVLSERDVKSAVRKFVTKMKLAREKCQTQ